MGKDNAVQERLDESSRFPIFKTQDGDVAGGGVDHGQSLGFTGLS